MTLQNFARICPFCEASCGLTVTADPATGEIARIAGDPAHPGSKGYLCPKSQGLRALRDDPDRLRMPLLREGKNFREIGWDEALDRAAAGIRDVQQRHGGAAMGLYTGNPQAHIAALQMCIAPLLGVMPALYTNSGSIDCYPRFLVGAYLYGNIARVPVPDIERTDFFLIFGGNPLVSHGSMMGAPGMPRRLERMKARGARLAVVDPRRTRTAEAADDHYAIRPGTDALLALGMIATLFEEGLVRLGRLAADVAGLDELRAVATRFPAERVADLCGIESTRIRQLARDFAAAPAAAAYSRVGTNCQSFGTLGVWAVDCLNVLTGNVDEIGGVMFPDGILPQFMHQPWVGDQPPHGRWRSRVSDTAELGGTMPTQVLWEEIETPGEGQIKGLLIVAGNPVLSNANANRVRQALGNLDFMVAIDIYLNETTRFADLILPPTDHLEHSEFTMIWNNWMVEDIVSYSPEVFAPATRSDWQIVTALAARIAGRGEAETEQDFALSYLAMQADRLPRLPAGMDVAAALAAADGADLPERIFDVLLRGGRHGDGFGTHRGGLSLARLKADPAGISMGAIRPGAFPAWIDTPDRKLHLAASIFLADIARLEAAVAAGDFAPDRFRLIGRRELRSNNSWMHNLTSLVKGPRRCTAILHPADAAGLDIADGDRIRLTSRVGEITIIAEVSDEVAAGTICAPHGWSEPDSLARLPVAHGKDGANYNMLSDDAAFDRPSGGASFNGTPVRVERVTVN